MIIAVRISGLVEVQKDINETLSRMRLRKKYSAVLLKETPENIKLVSRVRNFIAYGLISDETLAELLKKRGIPINKKKIDIEKSIPIIKEKGLEAAGFKPFFRLHPPRGGINSKAHFPIKKGVLGDNKEKINDLIRRML